MEGAALITENPEPCNQFPKGVGHQCGSELLAFEWAGQQSKKEGMPVPLH